MQICETLIITQSTDVTVEVVMSRMENSASKILRFNFDLFPHYRFRLTENDFVIADPVGREANLATLKKAYFRKPGRAIKTDGDSWVQQEELWQGMRFLIYLLWRHNKLVLVEPYCDSGRLDKMAQAALADRYFEVPHSYFCYRMVPNTDGPFVAKGLVRDRTGGTLYTTRINPPQADVDNFGWFFQDYIAAEKDLTVVYVRDRLFPFSMNRDFLEKTVDWRAVRGPNGEFPDKWEFIADFPINLSQRIHSFMRDARLHYGRLDFLWDGKDRLVFCEVNANGQFAWLDLEDRTGMISHIASEISPLTPINPIPFNPF
jgi:hypothetical protein